MIILVTLVSSSYTIFVIHVIVTITPITIIMNDDTLELLLLAQSADIAAFISCSFSLHFHVSWPSFPLPFRLIASMSKKELREREGHHTNRFSSLQAWISVDHLASVPKGSTSTSSGAWITSPGRGPPPNRAPSILAPPAWVCRFLRGPLGYFNGTPKPILWGPRCGDTPVCVVACEVLIRGQLSRGQPRRPSVQTWL